MIANALLVVHIAAGAVALAAAVAALATAKGGRMHRLTGRVYTLAMATVFVTAIPLALIVSNLFLLIIAAFSFYLVFAGWRFARNRSGTAHWVDWTAVSILGLTALAMWVYAGVIAAAGDAQWVTLALFGAIAGGLSLADFRFHRSTAKPGKRRIARHLTNMLAGTIATVTAVLVVNVDTDPVWLVWILPTVVITPLIVWWNVRIASPRGRRRAPGPAGLPHRRAAE